MPLDPRRLFGAREGPPKGPSGSETKTPQQRVTLEDFDKAKLRREITKESVTNWITLGPVGFSGAALVWTLIIGASPLSIVAIPAGLAFGVLGFAYNAFYLGDDRAEKRVSELRALMHQQVIDDFNALIAKCTELGFHEGAESGAELLKSYQNLKQYFAESKKNSTQYAIMAEDTFKQGSDTLSAALDVYKALRTVKPDEVKADLARLKKQKTPDSESAAKTLKQSIDDLERQVGVVTRRQELLEKLLVDCDGIQSELKTTYLELVDLGQDPSSLLVDNAAQRLHTAMQSRMESARQVEQALRGSDAEDAARRNKYRQTADDSATKE